MEKILLSIDGAQLPALPALELPYLNALLCDLQHFPYCLI